jgi:hypothetical protein
MYEVRNDRPEHGRIFKVPDIVFLTGFSNKPAHLRIMNVADAREKMMLDLII